MHVCLIGQKRCVYSRPARPRHLNPGTHRRGGLAKQWRDGDRCLRASSHCSYLKLRPLLAAHVRHYGTQRGDTQRFHQRRMLGVKATQPIDNRVVLLMRTCDDVA